MVMISRTPDLHERVRQELLREMRRNPDFKKTVRDSVKRILRVKLDYLKGPDSVPLYPNSGIVPERIPDAEGREFFFQHASRSITLIRDDKIPLKNPGKVLLAGQLRAFLNEGKRRYPEADQFFFPYNPFYHARASDIESLKNIAGGYDTIIFCLANPAGLDILKELSKVRADIIVFSVLTPIYLAEVPWVRSALAAYGTGIESIQAGFAVLNGDFPAEGKLPVSVAPR